MCPPAAAALSLASGARIPVLGLGMYRAAPGEETYHAVLSGLRAGYRHVDTAQVYDNEADVGRAVLDSGVPREDIFVTSKLWLGQWGHARAKAAVKESLQRLGLPYVDLFLLHAPGAAATRAETWRALEECRDEGLARDIGVSNFGARGRPLGVG